MQPATEPDSASAPADATTETELPLIDQRVMSDWCDDLDKEDVLAILARVPEEGARSLADLEKAITAGDVGLARRTAHRLKGMANNLGAVRLARMARAIEVGCQSVEEVSQRMASLEQTWRETMAVLHYYR
jgi:HPt (histidine-containing phosphotransfer) domain-containing protein